MPTAHATAHASTFRGVGICNSRAYTCLSRSRGRSESSTHQLHIPRLPSAWSQLHIITHPSAYPSQDRGKTCTQRHASTRPSRSRGTGNGTSHDASRGPPPPSTRAAATATGAAARAWWGAARARRGEEGGCASDATRAWVASESRPSRAVPWRRAACWWRWFP